MSTEGVQECLQSLAVFEQYQKRQPVLCFPFLIQIKQLLRFVSIRTGEVDKAIALSESLVSLRQEWCLLLSTRQEQETDLQIEKNLLAGEMQKLSRLRYKTGSVSLAIEALQQAIKIYRQTSAADMLLNGLIPAHESLFEMYMKLGDPHRASKNLERAAILLIPFLAEKQYLERAVLMLTRLYSLHKEHQIEVDEKALAPLVKILQSQ